MLRVIKYLLIVVVVLAAVAIVLPYVVPLENYRDTIVQKVSTKLNQPLSISGDMTYSLLPQPALHIDGVQLKSTPGSRYANWLSVQQTDVYLSWLDLLSGSIVVSRVRIDTPQLDVEKMNGGHWNIPLLQTSTKPASTTAPISDQSASLLVVRELDIINGTANIISKVGDKPTQLTLPALNVRMQALDQPVDLIATLSVLGQDIDVKGRLNSLPTTGSTQAQLNIKLGDGARAEWSGTLDVARSQADGNLKIQASKNSALIQTFLPKQHQHDLLLQTSLNASAERIDLPAIQGQLGTLTVRGNVQAILQPTLQVSGQLGTDGLSLKVLQPGRSADHMAIEIVAQDLPNVLKRLTGESSTLPVRDVRLSGQLMRTDTVTQLDDMILNLDQQTLRGVVRYQPSSPAQVRATVRGDVFDLNPFMSPSSSAPAAATTDHAATSIATASGSSPIIHLDGAFNTVRVQQQVLSDVNVKALIMNGVINLDPLTLKLMNALPLSIKGTVDTSVQPAALNLTADADPVDVNRMLAALGYVRQEATTTAQLNGVITGTTTNMVVELSSKAPKLSIDGLTRIEYNSTTTPPTIDADLRFKTLPTSLGTLQASSTTRTPPATQSSSAVSNKQDDFAFLSAQQGTIKLNIERLMGEGFTFTQVVGELLFKDQAARLVNFSAQGLGGNITANGSLAPSGDKHLLQTQMNVRDIDLGQIQKPNSDKRVVGRLNVSLDAQSLMRSMDDLKPNLNGQGNLSMTGVTLLGANIDRFSDVVGNIDRPQDFLSAYDSLNQGTTSFNNVATPITIQRGLMQLPPTLIQSAKTRGEAEGQLDLTRDQLNADATFQFVEHTDVPVFRLQASGSSAKPIIRDNREEVVNYVASKAARKGLGGILPDNIKRKLPGIFGQPEPAPAPTPAPSATPPTESAPTTVAPAPVEPTATTPPVAQPEQNQPRPEEQVEQLLNSIFQ